MVCGQNQIEVNGQCVDITPPTDTSGSQKVWLGVTKKSAQRQPTPSEIAAGRGRVVMAPAQVVDDFATVDELVGDFVSRLAVNDPSVTGTYEALVMSGRLKNGANLTAAANAYRSLLNTAAAAYRDGKGAKVSPSDIINNDMARKLGVGGKTPATQKQFREFTDAQAAERAQAAYKRNLGRAATAQEQADYVAKLRAAAKATPSITRYNADGSVSYTTSGFDIDTWEAGYIAGKVGEGDEGGSAGIIQDQIRAAAVDYGLGKDDITESFVVRNVRDIVKGDSNIETVKETLRDMAKSRYRALEAQIDRGVKIQDIADPYIARMSRILELPETEVMVTNPVIQNALSVQDEKGNYRTKTLREFEEELRKDPRWMKTVNAKEEALDMTNQILGMMGFKR